MLLDHEIHTNNVFVIQDQTTPEPQIQPLKDVSEDQNFGEYFNNLYGSSSDSSPFWYQTSNPLDDSYGNDPNSWSGQYSRSEKNNVEPEVLASIESSSSHNDDWMGFNDHDPFQNIAEGYEIFNLI